MLRGTGCEYLTLSGVALTRRRERLSLFVDVDVERSPASSQVVDGQLLIGQFDVVLLAFRCADSQERHGENVVSGRLGWRLSLGGAIL